MDAIKAFADKPKTQEINRYVGVCDGSHLFLMMMRSFFTVCLFVCADGRSED